MKESNEVVSSDKKIQAVIDRVNELPTLPVVVLKVMEILESGEVSLSDLSRMILGDQSLTAKVLKVVNSAYYGFPRKISTISLAVVILGTENVKNLILSISIMDLVSRRVYRGNIDRRKLWAHPLLCAAASRVLARERRYNQLEETFVAGLLHDIGKVVIDCYFHDAFIQIQSLAEEGHPDLLEVERRLVGMDHSEIGRCLCEKWNFPPLLSDAVALHHNSAVLDRGASPAAFVYLGNKVAHSAMSLSEGTNGEEEQWQHLAAMLDMSEQEVTAVLARTRAEFDKANVFLEL
jgi:putative nucleotidyltransferase with HDIG domain